jgi:hypothetical protein
MNVTSTGMSKRDFSMAGKRRQKCEKK